MLLVVLYHAGFSWMSGGFFGVEVFFVVSGFLITSLLLSEYDRSGRVSFRAFWVRRGRRLFPALAAVLLAVMVWTAVWGSAEQVAQVRRDVPWAVFYLSNWGQILGDIPYFTADPPILRHLWSLGIEEQWYVIWPVVVIGLVALRRSRVLVGALVALAGVGVMLYTAWLESRSPTVLGGPPGLFEGVDRTNFMYLSTVTRVSGLLLGAAAAFMWRAGAADVVGRVPRRAADVLGVAALAVIGAASIDAVITEGYVYRWLLPLVSASSLVAVVVAVGSESSAVRVALSQRPVVAVGLRSYGLYLWSWPIFVVVGATDGSVVRFGWAILLSAVVTELSYRFLEQPVRHGSLGRLWGERRTALLGAGAAVAALVGGLVVWYAATDEYDPLERGASATFDAESALGAADPTSTSGAAPTADPTSTSVAAPTTVPHATSSLPVGTAPPTTVRTAPGAVGQSARPTADVVVLGDSQGGSLVTNTPYGIEALFPSLLDGSISGCSVWDSGGVDSEVTSYVNFDTCAGWQERWAGSAQGADVALVALGAWDVFDKVDGDISLTFASPEFDARFAAAVRSGIDAVRATGVPIALLEVPCMRPIDVPLENGLALPERGDDIRVAHLNSLLRSVADGYGPGVQFVEGPDWCGQEHLAADGDLRWDGVHYVAQGSALVFETIAADLLRVAAS